MLRNIMNIKEKEPQNIVLVLRLFLQMTHIIVLMVSIYFLQILNLILYRGKISILHRNYAEY